MKDVLSNLRLVTPAVSDPVSVAEAKAYCRIDGSTEDTFIESLIKAAVQWIENHPFCARALMVQTYRLTLDRFPDAIVLPRPPLVSVSSVKYYDVNGDQQTLATDQYQVASQSEPARIVPAPGCTWPSTQDRLEAVEVNYTAGYANAASVPPGLKLAVLLLVSHWYRTREPVNIGTSVTPIALTVESLLSQHWHGQVT